MSRRARLRRRGGRLELLGRDAPRAGADAWPWLRLAGSGRSGPGRAGLDWVGPSTHRRDAGRGRRMGLGVGGRPERAARRRTLNIKVAPNRPRAAPGPPATDH